MQSSVQNLSTLLLLHVKSTPGANQPQSNRRTKINKIFLENHVNFRTSKNLLPTLSLQVYLERLLLPQPQNPVNCFECFALSSSYSLNTPSARFPLYKCHLPNLDAGPRLPWSKPASILRKTHVRFEQAALRRGFVQGPIYMGRLPSRLRSVWLRRKGWAR